MRVDDLCNFIRERERVRLAKEANKPRSTWTKDEILATYRFCNVHREHDAVTRWIAKHWRDPHAGHDALWFAMVFARLFNLPATLEHVGIGNVLAWRPELVRKMLHQRAKHVNIFNAAYIVSTNGKPLNKVDYLVNYVLGPLWVARKQLVPRSGDTLARWHGQLMQFDGLGSFMAAQVVADMKYVPPLQYAEDWNTFAAPGPGSRRGLNRVCERDVETTWPGNSWHQTLLELREQVSKKLGAVLHAQDLQNCLCEFDKYERVRLGEGRPKQFYQPKG